MITIVGARPQFVKAAMVSRAILEYNKNNERLIEELLLHTGQHYDANMSDIFFNSMSIPQPVWQLQCGNGTHGEMTGRMLIEIEKYYSTPGLITYWSTVIPTRHWLEH